MFKKTSLFLHDGFPNTTESKVSTLDNVVEKQALGKSIQIWTFSLGKETDNDKHNWIKDNVFSS